ncbi:MAG TPA: CDP-diacylglycerol--glycerol-3-phosphate 3-phosphatidyltransferase [Acidimicrobiales bacterium]|nr:CDP-diacylglycerol--glycerol-3-phosphate 3-phosphatidyltransferase [Acidimicrobiales bacterium]
MAANTFGPSALATPANAVTLVRILVLPFLILLILDDGSEWPALWMWIVLATSDLFDGWLARRHGATRSGAFLDPLADKFLVLGAMAALVGKGVLWWLPVGIIAVREVALSAYRSYVGRRGVSVPARFQAKVKTWVQAIAVGMAIAPVSGDAYRGIMLCVLWASVVLTVVTGVQYLWDGRRVIRGSGGVEAHSTLGGVEGHSAL